MRGFSYFMKDEILKYYVKYKQDFIIKWVFLLLIIIILYMIWIIACSACDTTGKIAKCKFLYFYYLSNQFLWLWLAICRDIIIIMLYYYYTLLFNLLLFFIVHHILYYYYNTQYCVLQIYIYNGGIRKAHYILLLHR